jgi:hypothetical protein
MEVDHHDGNGLNCQRINLRIATHAENQRNQRLTKQNTSGFKGVGWNKRDKAWQARIKVNGKLKHLGYFSDPVDAYAAYCKASAEMHGEFGRVR